MKESKILLLVMSGVFMAMALIEMYIGGDGYNQEITRSVICTSSFLILNGISKSNRNKV